MFLALVIALVVNILQSVRGRNFQGRIIDLPFGLILKMSSPTKAAKEADIIRFVQRHTSIPTPRVVASDDAFGDRYLVMKKVAGESLDRVWPTLEPAQRTRIVEQLRSYITQLRSLPSPHDRAICSLNGTPLFDVRITCTGPVGPFVNENAFNDRLLETTAIYDKRATLPEYRSRLRGDHVIVFTHGDIAPRNIMVDGDTIVALIDWEQSGWCPEHWEMVKAMWCPPYTKLSRDLWVEAVKDLFDKDYEAEWQVERDLSEYIVGFF
ncbi:kinase-like protein [Trametes versicolor FP-101664 SS1]|uniref:kinase-like protein n=1 Tax=Trametes versicolor (strain FP-101664) TaxID=717944 RepID=UPI0004624934|nr:kinase-like protein [Trametes versicolor FP-101664 SS1]EIW61308.1 kinase-like protein [Trametes versicolor FP-101664 SS1]